jgi:hypothetical protein
VQASRTRRPAVRDPAQVGAEAARGLDRTAVVDPDQEQRRTAPDPDPGREQDRTAPDPDPGREQDRMAVAPERGRGQMAADQERGQMAAGREQGRTAVAPERGQMVAEAARQPRRRAAEVRLRPANRAVVLGQHPGSTVVLAHCPDRAADRGQHQGSTAVRAG